jgi:hypothetical protein
MRDELLLGVAGEGGIADAAVLLRRVAFAVG